MELRREFSPKVMTRASAYVAATPAFMGAALANAPTVSARVGCASSKIPALSDDNSLGLCTARAPAWLRRRPRAKLLSLCCSASEPRGDRADGTEAANQGSCESTASHGHQNVGGISEGSDTSSSDGGDGEGFRNEHGGSGGNGRHGGGGGGGKSGGDSDGEASYRGASMVLPVLAREGHHLRLVAENASKRVAETANSILKVVPAQVLTALIGILSGVAAQRRNQVIQEQKEKESKEAKRRQKVAENERLLRELYDRNQGPLLKAAAKLSEQLYILATGVSDWHDKSAPYDGTVYVAYTLGRYLAYVEHIKRNSESTLNLGFPAADRIFLNILGRVQSSFAASDAVLARVQSTEEEFRVAAGTKPHRGGPFSLTPRSQASIGELMIKEECRAGQVAAEILTFSEFIGRLDAKDSELKRWMGPVIKELEVLRKEAMRANEKSRKGARIDLQSVVKTERAHALKHIGARPYMIQNALQDLIEFLDPAPFKTISPDHRTRLRIGECHHAEQQVLPPGLFALYRELGAIRDHKVSRDDPLRPFRGKPVEVFVTAPANSASPTTTQGSHLETGCPYSQRVVMCMMLMGIPFKVVPIDISRKPGWFHLLSGESRVPVIFKDGVLVSGSRHIMSYLIDSFPNEYKSGLSETLCSDIRSAQRGTMSYTRFYPAFRAALSGRAGARKRLENELRLLDQTLAAVQNQGNDTEARCLFLGGEKFSRADTSIIPMLHAVEVVGPRLKGEGYGIPAGCTALRKYLAGAREVPCFAKTAPSDDMIIDSYRYLVETQGDVRTTQPWVQDMLE